MNEIKILNQTLKSELSKIRAGLVEERGELKTIVETILASKRGPQGEAGYSPVKGVDYFDGKTPKKGVDYLTDKEVADFIRLAAKLVPRPQRGKDYYTPEDQKHFETLLLKAVKAGMPVRGVDYLTQSDEKAFVKKVLKSSRSEVDTKIARSVEQQDKSLTRRFKAFGVEFLGKVKALFVDNADDIARALETLKGNRRLDAKAIKNLPIPVTNIINNTGGGGVNTETPTPAADGATMIFTVTNAPKFVIVDEMPRVNGFGYTLSGAGPYTITINSLVKAPDQILSIY